MYRDDRLEQFGVARREVEDVFVGDVELRLLRIDRAVARVVSVEGEQTVLAAMLDVADEAHEPFGELRVGAAHIFDARGAEVDGELGAVERVAPRAHLRVDLVARAARAQPGDVRVVIDEPRGVNVREGRFDKSAAFGLRRSFSSSGRCVKAPPACFNRHIPFSSATDRLQTLVRDSRFNNIRSSQKKADIKAGRSV